MKLSTISGGVLSMNGEPFDSGENLVVAVHPFFGLYHGRRDHPDYIARVDEFISSREGTILTFEEENLMARTSSRYEGLGRVHNRLFVPTGGSSPMPKRTFWDKVMKRDPLDKVISYLDTLRGDKDVELMGGYLWGDPKGIFGVLGCLGVFSKQLTKRSIPFVFLDGLTFD